ncbi:hypothetical protein BGX38DRAFT_1274762 [Terfezia claveryi]|nr:hypothetical protein BGX38DRAFT_1274762 [Terfezia claveryi]
MLRARHTLYNCDPLPRRINLNFGSFSHQIAFIGLSSAKGEHGGIDSSLGRWTRWQMIPIQLYEESEGQERGASSKGKQRNSIKGKEKAQQSPERAPPNTSTSPLRPPMAVVIHAAPPPSTN